MDLRTERLRLVALTPGLARKAMEDREALGRSLGVRVPLAWPGMDFSRMLPTFTGSPVEPFTRLVVHAEDETLIGEAGFNGPPDRNGTLEIGYSIIPEYRGRGFASEATRALVEASFASPGIRRIVAESLDDNGASLRVLEKLGMRSVGSSGDTIRFELRKA